MANVNEPIDGAELEDIPSEEEQLRRYGEMGGFSRTFGLFFQKIGLGAPYIPRADQMKVFWLVGAAIMVNHYDLGILSLALPRIQADLAITDAQSAEMMSLLKMGILGSFLIALMADKMGRRRLLMLTIIGTALSTFATAFAQTQDQFVALQFMARCFSYTEDILCFVVIAEVMDARLRGWAVGALAALGAAGHGLAGIVYSGIDFLPNDWRDMYLIGAGPMLLLAWLRRSLEETDRFKTQKAAAKTESAIKSALRPAINLITAYPGRMLIICAAIFPFSFGVTGALIFMPKFLQDVHAFSPQAVAALFLTAGFVSVSGSLLAGRLSDRFGRRTVLTTGALMCTGAMAFFYTLADGPLIVASWMAGLFGFFAAQACLATMGAELFPTSYRSTASSVRGIVSAIGGVLGMKVIAMLDGVTADFATATILPILAAPLCAVVVLIFVQETAGRSLEDISPEKG